MKQVLDSARLAARTNFLAGSGCFEWTAHIGKTGYGHTGGEHAHRASYRTHVGSIPQGFQVHHVCGNRACVNPMHLEALPPSVHQRLPKDHHNARKTHCPQGHPYDEENTYVAPDGGRRCRTCKTTRFS